MKLYHPLMFVGLGGTGLLTGAELERRLRDDICGPDGTAFRARRSDALRYELPRCVQFVYADINQIELTKQAQRVVPGEAHFPAASRTAQLVRGLVPAVDTYPELARDLRLWAGREVAGWLPPARGEPRIMPLSKGAGQLPTIGRAVMFSSMRDASGPVVEALNEAIGRITSAEAAADLFKMGNGAPGNPAAVEVFVCFSVAGGTGTGLFFDFLHLIAELFGRTTIKPRIHPLVLMPSAFEEGRGGGRPAELNAARAVLDLFQLVDRQNSGEAEWVLGIGGDQSPVHERIEVCYPNLGAVTMRPGMVQTALLFSRPRGVTPEMLNRSVASMVQSLVGTELTDRNGADTEEHQSFTDSFINDVQRQVSAADGIGGRGVSTAQVASLTAPVDDLVTMVARRLLADGVEQMTTLRGAAEDNAAGVKRFFNESGLGPLLVRERADITEPVPKQGARNITIALSDRQEAMRTALDGLAGRLSRQVPELVPGFAPRNAVEKLLGEYDPFRVHRIFHGHAELSGGFNQLGAWGLLDQRKTPAQASEPRQPALRDGRGGFNAAKWHDPEVRAALQEQDEWYRARTNALWAREWVRQETVWQQRMKEADAPLTALTRALEDRGRRVRDDAGTRAEQLRNSASAVSLLLPHDGDLDRFHHEAVQQLTQERVDTGVLPAGAGPGDLLHSLVGTEGWRAAFAILRVDGGGSAERALDELMARIRQVVLDSLRRDHPDRPPLLPKLGDLLTEAAARRSGRFTEEQLEPLRSRLAGLVPPNYAPQGRGRLKVLVSYPASAPEPEVENFLRTTLNLPEAETAWFEFTPTTTESVTVVLRRSAMGITDVREIRQVLRTWADAVDRPQPQDFLAWRQRTSYDYAYLATREEHRVEILHRLLCAIWNGYVTATGDPASPSAITIRATDEVALAMPMWPLHHASSWANVLRAYERATIGDDTGVLRDFCAWLMRGMPDDIDTRPRPPDKLYRVLRALDGREIEEIDRMTGRLTTAARTRAGHMRAFWTDTMQNAVDREFGGGAIWPNLRALEKEFGIGPEDPWDTPSV